MEKVGFNEGIYTSINPNDPYRINELKGYANQGDASAMGSLGRAYYFGDESYNIEPNLNSAKFWLERYIEKADSGNIVAQYDFPINAFISDSHYLTSILPEGEIRKRQQKYKENIKRMSQNGNPDAIYVNACIEEGATPQFGGQPQWIKQEWKEKAVKAARLGSSLACWELYNILSYNFTPTNESIGYLKMGSKILDTFGARCLVMLGCIYADEGDKENQIKCLQQATRLGSYEAQTKLQSIKNRSYSAHNTTQSAKSGGCYVATCIYGSYDCPQVWTLRRFRDNTLAETMFGRAFIHTYYAISPTLVKWFGNTSWFKKMWKVPLDRMVSVLQKNGFEDTPYKDKNWK